MSSTLKVNGLTYRTIERDVEKMFKKFGKINEVFIPKDRFSGKSRGFAFVRFFNRDDAREALRDQDGRMYDGRRITIEWSRKDDGHERRAARRSRSRSPRRRSSSRQRRRSRSRSIRRDRSRDRYGSPARQRSRSRDRYSPDRRPLSRSPERDRYRSRSRTPRRY